MTTAGRVAAAQRNRSRHAAVVAVTAPKHATKEAQQPELEVEGLAAGGRARDDGRLRRCRAEEPKPTCRAVPETAPEHAAKEGPAARAGSPTLDAGAGARDAARQWTGVPILKRRPTPPPPGREFKRSRRPGRWRGRIVLPCHATANPTSCPRTWPRSCRSCPRSCATSRAKSWSRRRRRPRKPTRARLWRGHVALTTSKQLWRCVRHQCAPPGAET